MPITLGILAQSRQAVAASDFVLLETQVLGSSQASVTFSNVNTLAAGFKHLQIRVTARTNSTSDSADNIILRFNGDSGANYARHGLVGDGSTAFSFGVFNQTLITTVNTSTSLSTANSFGAGVIDILDAFSTSKNKTVRTLSGNVTNSVSLFSGFWNNTNAVTTILLDQQGGSEFVQHSRFSLYGVK